MATMNVSLPDKMKAWVEEQVQTGRYGNSSDYVRDLVRRDQERAAKKAEFERLVQEGIESGISPLTPDEVFANARRKAGVKTSDAA
jgi:antitoxin ParD1/3/4